MCEQIKKQKQTSKYMLVWQSGRLCKKTKSGFLVESLTKLDKLVI